MCTHSHSVHWVVWVVPFCQGRGFKFGGRGAGRGVWVTEPRFAGERISSLLAVGCRPCLNETSPEVATTPPRGSYLYLCLPRPRHTNLPAEAKSNTHLDGEGVSVRYSSRPTNQCKGRSEPFTENSADAPPRFGPLAPEDRARRVTELRAVLSAPAFQARLRAEERGEQP
jgi:hypothetical protein